jgi:hypothetical protein
MKGLPVLRTMTNRYRELNPTAFKVFGPKLIAMRESFADDALESRFLTEETGQLPMRSDISISLPDQMKVEALALRNRLLAWRFAERYRVSTDPSRAIEGISARSNQTALALLSLVDDPSIRVAIGDHLASGEAQAAAKRITIPHIAIVRILQRRFAASLTPYLTLADITECYNQETATRGELPMTPRAVGVLLRNRLGLDTMKTRGVYVISQSERGKIDNLAKRFGCPEGGA